MAEFTGWLKGNFNVIVLLFMAAVVNFGLEANFGCQPSLFAAISGWQPHIDTNFLTGLFAQPKWNANILNRLNSYFPSVKLSATVCSEYLDIFEWILLTNIFFCQNIPFILGQWIYMDIHLFNKKKIYIVNIQINLNIQIFIDKYIYLENIR